MEESIQQETAPSIDETMAAAYDRSMEEPAAPVEEPEETSEIAGGVETEEPPVGEVAEPEVPAMDAPVSWTSEAKAKFSELPPWAQAEIQKREQDFEKGYAKHAENSKIGQEFLQIAAPYQALIAAEGGTPAKAFTELLNTAAILRLGTQEQKRDLILQTAQQFGVDLGLAQAEPDYQDPQIAELKAEISRLNGAFYGRQQQEQMAVQNEALQIVQAFAADPKNEFYASVKEDMAALLREGRAKDMQDAYDKAIWANAETRKVLVDRQRADEEKKRVEDAKKKAAAAKKATPTKLNGAETGTPTKKKSIDETMAEAYDKAMGT